MLQNAVAQSKLKQTSPRAACTLARAPAAASEVCADFPVCAPYVCGRLAVFPRSFVEPLAEAAAHARSCSCWSTQLPLCAYITRAPSSSLPPSSCSHEPRAPSPAEWRLRHRRPLWVAASCIARSSPPQQQHRSHTEHPPHEPPHSSHIDRHPLQLAPLLPRANGQRRGAGDSRKQIRTRM